MLRLDDRDAHRVVELLRNPRLRPRSAPSKTASMADGRMSARCRMSQRETPVHWAVPSAP